MANGSNSGNGSNGSERPLAWQYCGNQIKLWRESAGIRREGLADEAGYSCEAIKAMERGVRKPQLRVLEIADDLFGAQGKLVAAVQYLKPEKFPSYSHDYMQAESEAVSHSSYENEFIPGLLQTEETARALLVGHCPPLDDETIEERVVARLDRQALLGKPAKAFSFVISETALRNRIVAKELHAAQLRRLREAGQQRNVTIQVMPSGQGYHPGQLGPFALLETPEHDYLGYEEGQTTGVLFSDPEKISTLRQRHDMILRQALAPEESARFVGQLAEEL